MLHTRARTASVLAFVLCISSVAIGVLAGQAAAGGTVSLSPTSGPIGTVVTFRGENCTATPESGGTTNTVRAYLRSSGGPGNPALGYASVDTTKTNRPFVGTFTIPDEWVMGAQPMAPAPGTYPVIFDCSGYVYGEVDMQSSFTITAPGTSTTTTTTTTSSTTSTTTTAPVALPSSPAPTFQPPASVPATAVPMTGTVQASVPAGGSIGIDEGGFTPGEVVEVVVYSTPVRLGSVTADSAGRAQGVLRLPSSVGAGEHTLVLYGADTVKRSNITVAAGAVPAPAPAARPTSPPAKPTPVAAVALTG